MSANVRDGILADPRVETFIGHDGKPFQAIRLNAETITDQELRAEFDVETWPPARLRACIANNALATDRMGTRWVTVCRDRLGELDAAAATQRFVAGPDPLCLA